MGLLVNIDVPDVDAAVSFYTRGLGFEFRRWLFGRDVAEMAAGPVSLFLLHAETDSVAVVGTAIRRHYTPHWTPVHLDIVVDDLEGAVDRAVAAGATTNGQIVEEEPCRFVTLRDPFGHGLCLLQFAEGGYDRVESG